MKRPNNFDELLAIAKDRPDVHGALSQVGISLKHVGYSMGGERWQTETKSGTQGDFSAIAFIHKPDGKWIFYDNKGRFGKNSIDPITFLREGFGISFDDAVYMLSGGRPSAPIAKPEKLTDVPKTSTSIPPKQEYAPPASAPDKLRNVKAYLIQTRKLPAELVNDLINANKIYAAYLENKENGKKSLLCAFRITDEQGNDVGCDSCSPIPNQKFKHLFECSDSRYAWCFSYGIEDFTKQTPIFFCESPIDTMSLCALSGTPGVYVSMAGLKDTTFNSIIEKLDGTPIICVDNDEAGALFVARHPDVQRISAPYGKDWNDTLKYYVENNMSYAFAPPDAAAAPTVPLEESATGGHVVHHETEERDPKKENGALDKGASEENYLQETTDGRLVAVINTDILDGIDTSTWDRATEEAVKKAASQELKKFDKGIEVNGLTITVNKTSRREFTRSNYSNALYRRSTDDFSNKMRAATSIDNILISTKQLNSDGGLKKTRADDFVDFYRGKVLLCVKNSKYEAEVLIGKTKKGSFVFYDLLEIHSSNFVLKINEKEKILPTVTPQNTFDDIPKDLSINSITENFEKVNTSDEKNSKPLNDEDPPIADSNEKLSQDELRATLEGKVKNVVENYRADPRALADYVLFTSRFNNYSANNLRLIWSQYPTAQFVTSAYDFSHGLPDKNGKPTVSEKIFIKKGERALRIWKPYDVKYTIMPDGTEKRSAWLTKSERELAKAENWKTLTRQYFTLVPVFDITQTTASPDVYPKLLGLGGTKGTSADKSFTAMKNYAENVLNCPVTVCDFEERKASVRGSFYPDLNEIRISDMLEGENKLSTLIHEIGHASLHADSYANVSKSTAQIELEADMYALMIERRLGIEPTDARCRHLKAHYDMYLAETKATDINADTTLFNNVIDRFREQVPLIDAYVDNINVAEAQTVVHQSEQVQNNEAQITVKHSM